MRRGAKLGVVQVHLFRPFSVRRSAGRRPPHVKAIAVLDRSKEPGACGEPLYQDVVTAFAEAIDQRRPRHATDRRRALRLGSKEFTPAMVRAVFENLASASQKNHFTIGITDDVSNTSLEYDPGLSPRQSDGVGCIFYGLGADGTVGANKNSIKIIGEQTPGYAQGFFVYDSKKSGSTHHVTPPFRAAPNPFDLPRPAGPVSSPAINSSSSSCIDMLR